MPSDPKTEQGGPRPGDGLQVDACEVELLACSFINNFCEGYGGAIQATQSRLRIRDTRFSGNRASGGGGDAIDSWHSQLQMDPASLPLDPAAGGVIQLEGDGLFRIGEKVTQFTELD